MFISALNFAAYVAEPVQMQSGTLTRPIEGTINVSLGVPEPQDFQPANYNLQLPFPLDDAIDRSRKALLDAGYNVIQIGHLRLLACQRNGGSPVRVIDLLFQRSQPYSTEVVCTVRS